MEVTEIVSQSTTIAVKVGNGDNNSKSIDANTTSNVKSRFDNSPEFEDETSMECVDSIVANTASMTEKNVEIINHTDEKKHVETAFESPLKAVADTAASKILGTRNCRQIDGDCIVLEEIKKEMLNNHETSDNVMVGIESSVQVVDASTSKASSVTLPSCIESTTMEMHNSSKDEATIDTDSVKHNTLLGNTETKEPQIGMILKIQSGVPHKQSDKILEPSITLSSKIGEHTKSTANMGNNLSILIDKPEKSVNMQVPKKVQLQSPVTSLSVIATAYDTSDSESEEPDCICEDESNLADEHEKEVQITKEYRTMTIETSDEDSDSDDSSSTAGSSLSSGTDSDNSSNENNKRINNCKKKNESNARQKGSHEKELKGEFDDLPPIEDLKISVPEVLCDPLGEVGWMVEQMVVVRPKPGKPTLNLDTMLFVERGRRVLGRIFDVFGQVSEPHYCVRFNSTDHIKESDIKVGMTVYFCPNTEYTSVVFVQDLLKMKVTDELGDDEHPEFSDDEEERAYFAALKQKQKNEKAAKSGGEVPQKRQRMAAQRPTWKSNHPWSSSRNQQQPGKTYNTPGWPDSSQQNACPPTNLWHYPSAYPNNPWSAAPEPYQGNAWPAACPQNAYGYSEQFGSRPPRPNARPFFRPHQSFQSGHNPYAQNRPYAQQSNSPRYPGANFPWRSQSPRQPGMTWSLVPPPPPPPPGM